VLPKIEAARDISSEVIGENLSCHLRQRPETPGNARLSVSIQKKSKLAFPRVNRQRDCTEGLCLSKTRDGGPVCSYRLAFRSALRD
jgi:hypothetical protein